MVRRSKTDMTERKIITLSMRIDPMEECVTSKYLKNKKNNKKLSQQKGETIQRVPNPRGSEVRP